MKQSIETGPSEFWLDSVLAAIQRSRSLASDTPPHFLDVAQFHSKFGLVPERAAPLPKKLARQRADQMREELREFEDACADNDAGKAVDALCDMVYFALGAACQMGVTPQCWEACWDAVHKSNMSKERIAKLDTLKQGIVKPAGWISPQVEIYRALQRAGFLFL